MHIIFFRHSLSNSLNKSTDHLILLNSHHQSSNHGVQRCGGKTIFTPLRVSYMLRNMTLLTRMVCRKLYHFDKTGRMNVYNIRVKAEGY